MKIERTEVIESEDEEMRGRIPVGVGVRVEGEEGNQLGRGRGR